MIKFLILFFIILSNSFLSAHARSSSLTHKTKVKKLNVTNTVETSFYSYKEGPEKSDVAQFKLTPNLSFELLKSLKLNAKGSVAIQSGRVQARFENPDNASFNLENLSLDYSPTQYLKLKLGALDQSHFQNDMFIYKRAFLGASIESGFQNKIYKAKLKTQYTIPTSTSLESDRTGLEKTPSFLSAGLEFGYKLQRNLKLSSQINYFKFSNLPSIVAFDSSRMGNSVIGQTQSESYFKHAFEGLLQTHKINWSYTKKLQQNLITNVIDNFEAPKERRRSQLVGTKLSYSFKDFDLRPGVAYFFAESDSNPAAYAHAAYGRNNREGLLYSISTEFKKLGFSISLQYIDAKTLGLAPSQNDFTNLELAVEVANVKF